MRTPVFCSAENQREFCIVVSLSRTAFPHDRWPGDHPQKVLCGITSTPAHALTTASCSDFVLGSLSQFKMILRKPISLMKPTRNNMEYAVGSFLSQQVAPVLPYLLSRQIRIVSVSAFSCDMKPWSKATMESFFLAPLPARVHSNRCCPPTPSTFDTKFLSTRGIIRIHSYSGNLCSQWLPRLHRFPLRHLQRALQLVPCHHRLEPDPCSEFSSDLRARCPVILVSWLLRLVHSIGFC